MNGGGGGCERGGQNSAYLLDRGAGRSGVYLNAV